MSMKINGSSSQLETAYARRLKEEQPADRMEKEAKEAENRGKAAEKASVLHDEYISSEKADAKPSGLYRLGKDENGSPKVFYDDPAKSGNAKQASDKKAERAENKPEEPGKAEEKCTASTDKVEKEIRKLKEKKQQLEQQIRAAGTDEKKIRELEKKLAQTESELSLKDTESYRRQHTVFSE